MTEFRRPFYPDVVLPEGVTRAAERESHVAHAQTIRIRNWMIVQEAGRQEIYLLVAVRDTDLPPTDHSGD